MEISNHIVSVRERKIIIDDWHKGVDVDDIAKNHRLKKRTIQGYIRRWLDTGSVLTAYEQVKSILPNGVVPRTRPLQKNPLYEKLLLAVCNDDPTTSLYEYQRALMGRFGIYASTEAIRRTFKDHHITWKTISRVAIESDAEEEYLFFQVFL